MKHWISGEQKGVENLHFETGDRPEPDDHEILVQVHAAALNFSDILMLDDQYQIRPPRPFTPGQELAGIVVKAGANSGFKTGDRITSKVNWGAFSENALVRADMAIAIPDDIDFTQAAALPVSYTTALVGLSECVQVKAGDTVLVHAAAGGVGIAAVQVAKAYGATVIATAGGEEKVKLALKSGADHAIDYNRDDWVAAVKEITGNKGPNIIFDSVGGDIALQSLRCIARDGTLLIVGFSGGTIPKLPANYLLLKRCAAKGVYWNHDQDGEMLMRVSKRMFDLLAQNKITPLISGPYPLEKLPQALTDMAARKTVGKVIISITSSDNSSNEPVQ
ncbi:NADPH:quinone oxidoreductase family protein [Ochrobactrum vermis]|uniref:NADPH:quinone oxidoreductase family protein n=1 Tax=Ochrobactrum vermis TaxID=1827297 RepID=A0ABU8PLH0_9HYPH|nr:NADPH:quinone oxidoreductase family protein [Ochrobactrum vermis]PQZ24442.1 hypothetical protein CQZ93_25870 [Ochrobactrum vermis]